MSDEQKPADEESILVQFGKATALALVVVALSAGLTFSCGVLIRAFRIGAGL